MFRAPTIRWALDVSAAAWTSKPLPRSCSSRFLSIVTEPWFVPTPTPRTADVPLSAPSTLQRGIAAGLVAAAANIGLLIGIGRRAGTAFRPLNATAYAVIGTRADGVWGFGHVTIIGVLVVLALSAVAGILA